MPDARWRETTMQTPQLLGEPERPLADVRDYSDLHLVMRAQAEALEVSRAKIDHVAGLESGYAAKILQPKSSKRLGPVSWSSCECSGSKCSQ